MKEKKKLISKTSGKNIIKKIKDNKTIKYIKRYINKILKKGRKKKRWNSYTKIFKENSLTPLRVATFKFRGVGGG